jgi:hypothetical protein
VSHSRGAFPVAYYHVEPRLSVRVIDRYWFNAAWYRYEFDRRQNDAQDYRAEGALFSLSASF